MTWFEAIPAIAISVGLLLLIGAPVAWAIGSRGITFLAMSIGSSVAAVAISAVLAPIVRIPWSVTTPFLFSIPLALVALLLRRWLIRPQRHQERNEWSRPFIAAVIGVLIGATLIAFAVVPAIAHPDNPSQTYDGIFHLNAVRWILDTHDASPLHMTMTQPASSTAFYPTIWHAFVAVVVQLSGVSIMVATNAFALAVSAVVWPVACVFFARALFGQRTIVLLMAGVLSAAFATFPLQLLWYGVLYPNLFAFALLPIALGSLAFALRWGAETNLSSLGRWLITALIIAGMSVTHPNAFFSLLALSAPLVILAAVGFLQRHRNAAHAVRRIALTVGLLLVVFAVEGFLWTRLGTSDNSWQPTRRFYVSVAEALVNGPGVVTAAIAATVLVLGGVIVALFRRRWLWIAVAYGVTVLLFAVANGWPAGALRTAITGLWYNDSLRLSALLPITALPLAVLFTTTVVQYFQRFLGKQTEGGWLSGRGVKRLGAAVTVIAVVLVAFTTQGSSIRNSTQLVAEAYSITSDSAVLSPSEREIFTLVDKLTPRNAVIANNPWNGSALAYAYTGRRVLFPHVAGRYPQPYHDIAEGLASGTPAACAGATSLGVKYVLDFGKSYVFEDDPRAAQYSGLTNMQDSSVVTLLAQRSDARLYEITGC